MKVTFALPALLIITTLVSLSATLAFASNIDMKNQLLNGYLQRCVEVLNSKNYDAEAIKAECKCELDQIDQHYNLFSLMLDGTTSGKPVTAEQQLQINDLKKRLLQCKTKPQGHVSTGG